MSIESRLASIEASLALILSKLGAVTSSAPAVEFQIDYNDDGSYSIPSVQEFARQLSVSGDERERAFSAMIPRKFLVMDENLRDQTEEIVNYVSLNCDRARMQVLALRTSGADAYAFSWIVHKVKKVGNAYDFDMDAGQVMNALAYPPGVNIESVPDRIRVALQQFKSAWVVDGNDFSPG
jgi:hypothetical protein